MAASLPAGSGGYTRGEYHSVVMARPAPAADPVIMNHDSQQLAGDTAPELDDRFLSEWLAYGFREMGAYLDKQARFAAYLDRRND